MKVSSYEDTPATKELEGVMKREVITPADGAPNFTMRIFDVAHVVIFEQFRCDGCSDATSNSS